MKRGKSARVGGRELKRATRLFKSRKFFEVIRLLEPQVFRFRESVVFYYLLGVSCLYAGDFGGSYSYLKRVLQLNPRHVNGLLGLAAVYLKRKNNSEAILNWLAVLEIDPKNSVAKRGLNILKKNTEPDGIYDLVDSPKFRKLFPQPESNVVHLLFITISSLFGLLLLTAVIFFLVVQAPSWQHVRSSDVEKISLKGITLVSGSTNKTETRYTEKELQEIFNKAKSYFNSYHDNLAQRAINKILHSNASQGLKERVILLQKYLTVPNFLTIKDLFGYQEVIKSPSLYENCYVKWQGRIANLVISSQEIRFDLLVGYRDEKILEGIVPVELSFAVSLVETYPYEILGKVLLRDSGIELKAIGIHLLANHE